VQVKNMANHQAQPAEQQEGRTERTPAQQHDTSHLVSLNDMRDHQTAMGSRTGDQATSGTGLERGGLNMDTRGLYTQSERERTEKEKTTKEAELVKKSANMTDVVGNEYVHVSGPELHHTGETKSVSVTERVANNTTNTPSAPAESNLDTPRKTTV
jgi:hypothetical protein